MRRIAAFLFAVLLCLPAIAQDTYPRRPITLIPRGSVSTRRSVHPSPFSRRSTRRYATSQLEKIETELFGVDQVTPAAHRAKLASQIDLLRPIIEKADIQAE